MQFDIYNLSGRHLNSEEICYVVEERCKDIGVKFLRVENKDTISSIKKAEVMFTCSECNEESVITFGSLEAYKKTTCKKCGDRKKQGRFKRKSMNKEILQSIVDNNYKDKDISFVITEDFTYENNKQKISIKCTNCGKDDESRIDLLTQNRKSCTCQQIRSKLELETVNILEKHNMTYNKEHGFEDLRMVQPLRYDFCVIDNENLFLIECDGIQHFYPTFGKKSFESTTSSDIIKDNYAKDNNIPLLRIKYNTKESVENMILEFINS